MRRWMTTLVLAMALLLPLAACAGDDTGMPEAGDAAGEAAMPETAAEDATASERVDAPEADEAPVDAAEDSDSEDEMAAEEAVAEVKKGLEATDPATLQLASGSPQLVEFFAFW